MTEKCCDLLGGLNVDDILGVRDSIGAVIHPVFMLVRKWSGKEPGDGFAMDTTTQILPTPGIKEYAHDIRLVEAGAIKQGDIVLKGISKESYPKEDSIDGKTNSKSIEKFYLIDDRLYTVINVKENYVTWDVQIRKLSNQTRYQGGSNGK